MRRAGGSADVVGTAAGGRRMIAVVYAEMVGYSRLISLDDAGTLRRLRMLWRALIDPAIRACGSKMVQTGTDVLSDHARHDGQTYASSLGNGGQKSCLKGFLRSG